MTRKYHHPCGYKIWHVSRQSGETHVDVFIDDDYENSPTYGEAITTCPGCGEALLSLDDLRDEPPEESDTGDVDTWRRRALDAEAKLAQRRQEDLTPTRQRLLAIADALDALHEQAQAIRDQMAALEAQGIVDASPYWRKNRDGEKTILTFTHSTSSERVRSGKSRSQYIGDKNAAPEKVQAALDALDRYKEHAKLKRDLADLEGRIAREQSTISTMLLRLKNEQTKLPI